jgi:membrane protease YdiL (CAAX protease family)
MTEIDSPRGTQVIPPPWGYFATLGWCVLAYVVSSTLGFAALMVLSPGGAGNPGNLEELMKNAWFFSASTLAAAPFLIVILMAAARLAGWSPTDYLALHWPTRRQTAIALGALVIFLPLMDGISYLLGQPIVSQFQIDLYQSAEKSGTLLLLWLALVVAAPVGEEVAFRGFLFRGWTWAARDVMPAIVFIAAVFAILHIQYNWFGMLQVFAIGFVLTWFRWVGGSTLLTILMHAIVNAYSTLQTVVYLDWQP